MLDGLMDQGASLRHLREPGARLLPVVCNGESETELPLLWHLCSALDELDYGVTALDGSAHETHAATGLLECLKDGHWPPADGHSRWTVLPSAVGLRLLAESSDSPHEARERLGHAFVDSDALVTYASPGTLLHLLGASAARPLLLVQPEPRSVLNAYQTVKYLHAGGLQATAVTLVDHADEAAQLRAHKAHTSLRDCVQQHLGVALETLMIRFPSSLLWPTEDICSLALRLLETAVVLPGGLSPRTAPVPLPDHRPAPTRTLLNA